MDALSSITNTKICLKPMLMTEQQLLKNVLIREKTCIVSPLTTRIKLTQSKPDKLKTMCGVNLFVVLALFFGLGGFVSCLSGLRLGLHGALCTSL